MQILRALQPSEPAALQSWPRAAWGISAGSLSELTLIVGEGQDWGCSWSRGRAQYCLISTCLRQIFSAAG